MKMRAVIAMAVGVGCMMGASWVAQASTSLSVAEQCDASKTVWCLSGRLKPLTAQTAAASMPRLATPAWMTPSAPTGPRTVTYSVSNRGNLKVDLDSFKTSVADTLSDLRGWAHLMVNFSEVESGGDFTIFLSEAGQMSSFGAAECTAATSCTVGRAVVINQNLWQTAPTTWKKAGGTQDSYQIYAVNHGLGYWLGHGDATCTAKGSDAAVMQSTNDFQGCKANPWPLGSELYAPALGIRS